MTVELHVPRLAEMAERQAWLSDPATMAHNKGRDLGGAEGYHPDIGCIDFPRENWRWWRQVWLYNAPDFYSAYIRDTENQCFVGEVCWFREGEDFTAGILIAAPFRGKGFCAPALRALLAHAFTRDDIPALKCAFPQDNLPARKGFLRAGFHDFGTANGLTTMICTKEDFENQPTATAFP